MEKREYQLNLTQRKLLTSMKRIAKEQGLEITTATIPFTNNDVQEFLEKLRKFEEESRKVRIMISSYHSSQVSYAT